MNEEKNNSMLVQELANEIEANKDIIIMFKRYNIDKLREAIKNKTITEEVFNNIKDKCIELFSKLYIPGVKEDKNLRFRAYIILKLLENNYINDPIRWNGLKTEIDTYENKSEKEKSEFILEQKLQELALIMKFIVKLFGGKKTYKEVSNSSRFILMNFYNSRFEELKDGIENILTPLQTKKSENSLQSKFLFYFEKVCEFFEEFDVYFMRQISSEEYLSKCSKDIKDLDLLFLSLKIKFDIISKNNELISDEDIMDIINTLGGISKVFYENDSLYAKINKYTLDESAFDNYPSPLLISFVQTVLCCFGYFHLDPPILFHDYSFSLDCYIYEEYEAKKREIKRWIKDNFAKNKNTKAIIASLNSILDELDLNYQKTGYKILCDVKEFLDSIVSPKQTKKQPSDNIVSAKPNQSEEHKSENLELSSDIDQIKKQIQNIDVITNKELTEYISALFDYLMNISNSKLTDTNDKYILLEEKIRIYEIVIDVLITFRNKNKYALTLENKYRKELKQLFWGLKENEPEKCKEYLWKIYIIEQRFNLGDFSDNLFLEYLEAVGNLEKEKYLSTHPLDNEKYNRLRKIEANLRALSAKKTVLEKYSFYKHQEKLISEVNALINKYESQLHKLTL